MILSKEETRQLYRRTARFYDAALLGFRALGDRRLRKRAIAYLRLQPGDTVVDLGCGTGLNFKLLHEAVGANGRIVGVDLTDAMLARATRRVEKAGWNNVDLIEEDLATYQFPANASGALATFALEMVPEYDTVIRRASESLSPGGRLAVVGLKVAERWPEPMIRFGIWLNKPFGASRDYARIKPWEAVRLHMNEMVYREFYLGAGYMSVGEARELSDGSKRSG